MREERASEVLFRHMEEVLQVIDRLALDAIYVGIESLQEKRTPGGFRPTAPELADLRFLEDVEATRISSAPSPVKTTLNPLSFTSLDSKYNGAGAERMTGCSVCQMISRNTRAISWWRQRMWLCEVPKNELASR